MDEEVWKLAELLSCGFIDETEYHQRRDLLKQQQSQPPLLQPSDPFDLSTLVSPSTNGGDDQDQTWPSTSTTSSPSKIIVDVESNVDEKKRRGGKGIYGGEDEEEEEGRGETYKSEVDPLKVVFDSEGRPAVRRSDDSSLLYTSAPTLSSSSSISYWEKENDEEKETEQEVAEGKEIGSGIEGVLRLEPREDETAVEFERRKRTTMNRLAKERRQEKRKAKQEKRLKKKEEQQMRMQKQQQRNAALAAAPQFVRLRSRMRGGGPGLRGGRGGSRGRGGRGGGSSGEVENQADPDAFPYSHIWNHPRSHDPRPKMGKVMVPRHRKEGDVLEERMATFVYNNRLERRLPSPPVEDIIELQRMEDGIASGKVVVDSADDM